MKNNFNYMIHIGDKVGYTLYKVSTTHIILTVVQKYYKSLNKFYIASTVLVHTIHKYKI